MKYFPDQNELQMRQRLKVGGSIDHHLMLLNLIYRSLWSITGEVHIKGSGV